LAPPLRDKAIIQSRFRFVAQPGLTKINFGPEEDPVLTAEYLGDRNREIILRLMNQQETAFDPAVQTRLSTDEKTGHADVIGTGKVFEAGNLYGLDTRQGGEINHQGFEGRAMLMLLMGHGVGPTDGHVYQPKLSLALATQAEKDKLVRVYCYDLPSRDFLDDPKKFVPVIPRLATVLTLLRDPSQLQQLAERGFPFQLIDGLAQFVCQPKMLAEGWGQILGTNYGISLEAALAATDETLMVLECERLTKAFNKTLGIKILLPKQRDGDFWPWMQQFGGIQS